MSHMHMGEKTTGTVPFSLPMYELKGERQYKMFREIILPKNFFSPFFSEVEFTGRGTSEITRTMSKLSFVKVDPHFRQGIPFFGQVEYFSVHKSTCVSSLHKHNIFAKTTPDYCYLLIDISKSIKPHKNASAPL